MELAVDIAQIAGVLALVVAIIVGYHFSNHTKRRTDQNEERESRTFHDARVDESKVRAVLAVTRELRSSMMYSQVSVAPFAIPPQDSNDLPDTHLPYYFAVSCLYLTRPLRDFDPSAMHVPEVDDLVVFEFVDDDVVHVIEHVLPVLGYKSYFVTGDGLIANDVWIAKSPGATWRDYSSTGLTLASSVPATEWEDYRFALFTYEDCVIWVHRIDIGQVK